SVTVNADAVKTSAGALHTLPVCREKNIIETLRYLKESGIRIVCATEKGTMNYTKSDYTEPVCVVMGAEDTGIPVEHLRLCDDWVSIPQFGNIESLNVSVATAVVLYEAVRQRHLTE
ncbi:MAG: RNA methyltransferase, partial [Bacteroidaceae bacterium]|nr:RNA methyltransferase [Bacteroidaceae bacterium]